MPASFKPYTYIQCPCCSDAGSPDASAHAATPALGDPLSNDGPPPGDNEEDDKTFDPRSPRANYSLYPLEYLLYCEDCHQIRCPRCVAEEIVTYFCPNCLFEVPTSNLKSEGNRCTRSCFQCPICVSPLTVTNLETPSSANLAVPESTAAHGGPYVLTCSYCQWSSTEIGIQFDKPNGIYSQLAKLRNGGKPRLAPRDRRDRRRELGSALTSPPLLSSDADRPPLLTGGSIDSGRSGKSGPADAESGLDLETQYSNLKHFYQRQLAESSGSGGGGLSSLGDLGFGSPSSLSRIMNMYTSGLAGGSRFDKKAQSRVRSMREARDESEGFVPANLDESAAIARLHGRDGSVGGDGDAFSPPSGWEATASAEQRSAQIEALGEGHLHGRTRFLDELRPIPFLLRTKRSKRCPICRHIISKPEAKSTNNRFRIRLVAGGYIPSISIRPLAEAHHAAPPPSSSSRAAAAAAAAAAAHAAPTLLEPLKPVQYILTFKNPIFESVKVTLAAPSTTAGRFASKVTVLCPQFEIDSNTDVWDDALRDTERGAGVGSGAGGSGSGHGHGHGRRPTDDGQHQAIAGKIWERGRNWVSIVLEVVPPSLDLQLLAMASQGGGKDVDLSPLRADEDVVEIPMFVRVEWEAEVEKDGVGASVGKDRDAKEKRELAYWCVLGIGRVRH